MKHNEYLMKSTLQMTRRETSAFIIAAEVPQGRREMWRFTELRSAAAPLFYSSKLLGLAPISNAAYYHETEIRHTMLGALYGVIVIAAYCAHLTLGLNELYHSEVGLRTGFTLLFGLLVTYASDLLLLVHVLSAYLHQKGWITTLRSFSSIDDTMSRLGFTVSYKSIGTKMAIYLAFLFLGNAATTLYNFFYGTVDKTLYQLVISFSYVLPMNANSLMKMWYLFFVCLIYTKVRQVNDRLTEICEKAREDRSEAVLGEVDRLVKLHERLCEMSVHIDGLYSLEILLSIGYAFVVVTSQLYFGYLSFAWSDRTYALPTQDLATPILWAAFMLVDVVSLSSACSKAKSSAKRSAVIMHKIANHIDTEQVYTKINHISIKMKNHIVSFTAGGFFAVDMTVLYTMAGAVTGYLIILIQFDLASRN